MSLTHVETVPRWRRIGLWSLKVLLAAVFFAAGGAKLAGVPMMVESFEHLGLGQWFRYVTGTLEVIGAVMILLPAFAAFGGALLATIMVGAILAHLFAIPGSPIPAIVLFALSGLIVFAHRDQIESLTRRIFDDHD
ncbi:DoxX family protein [Bosea vaviloviae]|uniref:DoxX family protein n=1 Tax=Bosea vaviloviae TaxID=1526658 RepID=A0A1D7TWQ9_9HYPH|nr:DoxX family protein [Bosea vaviloviae]AOO79536.1 DoxX family protein [Bosea vaviloviae]